MIRQLKFLSLIFLSFNCFSQNTSECDLMDKGFTFYEAKNIDSALYYWNYVVKNYPDTTKCFRRTVNNIFYVYYYNDQLDSAIYWGNYILNSNFNDWDPGWRGITQRFANYHYWTSVDLAFIYESKGDLDKAIYYTWLADTLYQYKSVSATSFEKEEVIIANDKSNFYLKNGDTARAICVLVNKAIDFDIFFRLPEAGSLTYLDFYSDVIETVLPLIENEYGKKIFYKEFKKSLENMEISKVKIGNNKDKDAFQCKFMLYNQEYIMGTTDIKMDKETWRKNILKSTFVKALKEK